jgi:hypothetical protein
MKNADPLELIAIINKITGVGTYGTDNVSFVKVFKNVIGIDALMTLRAYYLDTKDDEQFKIYKGMDAYDSKDKDKYYYPEDIYYATSTNDTLTAANDILTYSGVRKFNINYDGVTYEYPTNSLVIVIKESDYDSSKNKSFEIERTGQEGEGVFNVEANRITVQNDIMEPNPNTTCYQGGYYNSFNCNRFLQMSKNVKNIIFISKSPIQPKYPSNVDGLIKV